MKVALVYDRVNKFGGAERVLLALHEIFPDAPLFTSVYDKIAAPWADVFEMKTSFLQKLPPPKNAHEYYPFLMGPAFETFNFDEFDVVISVTHEFAKAIITKPQTLHLCYCLTPVSYLWEPGYSQYFYRRDFLKAVSSPLIKYLRRYDKIISHRPDKYIAISKAVQKRIKKYYGLDSAVIYPPVSQEFLLRGKRNSCEEGDFFLIVSRLVPNKRLDIAVEAFNQLGLQLKIIGTGRELNYLKSLARPNIEFLGFRTDAEIASYYEKCRAVIICGEEDFNIVAVEAQGFGKPVIAFRGGGVTETVIEGKTGFFFSEQTPGSLITAIKNVKKVNPQDCINNVQKYSKERFKKEFKDYVLKSLDNWKKAV